MTSGRLPADLSPNPVSRAHATLCASGTPVIDLTLSNPTRAGLPYPADLLAPLADPRGLSYEPDPLGLWLAREAVSADFARRGLDVPPGRIGLTASTSEAYALLFKLLCDPGDAVLVPRPSYPLFEHLTSLESVKAIPYDLHEHDGWRLDPHEIRRAINPGTRAILVVSPNNPTGSCLTEPELDALVTIAHDQGLALIGDEVFADYLLEPPVDATSVLTQDTVLTFGLGGLSKSAGLPQLKLGWIGMRGPSEAVAQAVAAYEVVADAYLSVSTPVQVAAPALLVSGAGMRAEIQARLRRNLAALDVALRRHPSITRLPVEGGWSAVLHVPAIQPEEALVLGLLTEDHVLVHPGYFFDFPREAFLIVSLLPTPELFDIGLGRVLSRAAATEDVR